MACVSVPQMVEIPKLQEPHTSPYYQQKEKRKRRQSDASVDSGYSADSPMEVAIESEIEATKNNAWGVFKSREVFVEMHIC
ncbi:hypothetical protein BOX15_Mlig013312g2 [Macrostomum lignano]|uniref:Uncharacterized protein n=1 Tax=Macrostomum lignano TaxID=282301 RepID=A0A267FTK4_9PLAT|nr:hypothetical protein BOX15_Mlig013312g2 [Macrostomum lignano]